VAQGLDLRHRQALEPAHQPGSGWRSAFAYAGQALLRGRATTSASCPRAWGDWGPISDRDEVATLLACQPVATSQAAGG
jgi:hypothetical protein